MSTSEAVLTSDVTAALAAGDALGNEKYSNVIDVELNELMEVSLSETDTIFPEVLPSRRRKIL